MSATNHIKKSDGFTLIEILIIAPIVILAVSGFVALMISMVGEVLVTRDHNKLIYEAQDTLDRIEQDTRLSVQFLSTTSALPTPQGSNNNFTGTAAFTNNADTLLLKSIATDRNPREDTRSLIYYANNPYPCGDQQSFNKIFTINVIYFIKDNALWRRVYVPNYNHNSPADSNTVCSSAPYDPWQQNTCSPGYTATRCQTEDSKIMENIDTLNVKYYSDPNSTTELAADQAASATTISITVNGKKTTAGKNITATTTLRATKINNLGTN